MLRNAPRVGAIEPAPALRASHHVIGVEPLIVAQRAEVGHIQAFIARPATSRRLGTCPSSQASSRARSFSARAT